MKDPLTICMAALYSVFLIAPLLAPYEETEQHREAAMEAPVHVHLLSGSSLAWPYVTEGSRSYPLRLLPRWHHVAGVQPPAHLFLFGSDEYGRDLLSRFLYGGRRAFLVGLFAALMAVCIGFGMGALAGFYEGWVDATVMRASELFLSMPWMYLLLAIRALLPLRLSGLYSLVMIVGVAGLAGWPGPARVVRGIFLIAKQRPYIAVARSLGASNGYLILKHILPEVRPVLWAQAATLLPRFMLADVALSFLGLGEGEPYATWGGMLASLRHLSNLESHRGYLMEAAAIALVLFSIQFAVEQKTKTRSREAN